MKNKGRVFVFAVLAAVIAFGALPLCGEQANPADRYSAGSVLEIGDADLSCRGSVSADYPAGENAAETGTADVTGSIAGDSGPDGASEVYGEIAQLEEIASEEGMDYDGYIFQLKDGSTEPLSEEMPEGVEKVEYSADTFTAEDLEQIADFAPEKAIEYIEPNYTVTLFGEETYAGDDPEDSRETDGAASIGIFSQTDPDDPYYAEEKQWNLDMMHVPAIWNYGIEGQDLDSDIDMDQDGIGDDDPVIVGVIDSGLKEDHEDIDADRVLEGVSFVSGVSSTDDELGHGTFVSGMIMATKDNGVGIAGIAQDVQVMPIRVFQSNSTDTATIVSAIRFAAEERAAFNSSGGEEGTNIAVINMSLGSAGASTAMENAINDAIAEGIIVVCAAGNDGNTTASYPAQYAIGVGSVDQDGIVSSYSQRLSSVNGSGYQNKVWVTAPGEKVSGPYYTSTSSYLTGSGTSFSSPEVAALAAVCKGLDNDLTHAEFRQLLRDTAVPKSGSMGTISGQDAEYGWGLVDFEAAVSGLIGDMSGTSAVTLDVKNGAGSEPANPVIRVFEAVSGESGAEEAGQEILPDPDGVYTLNKGKRYIYKASASGYEEQSGIIVALTDSRHIGIVLAGPVYASRFIVRNTAGEILSGAEITLTTAAGRPVARSANGSFPTRCGAYRYTVTAGGYFPASGRYVIDDTKESLSEADGYTVQVLMHGDIDVCSVSFEVLDADSAAITDDTELQLLDEDGNEIVPYEDGYFKLPPGTYSYTAENSAYRTVNGSFVITEDSKGLVRMKRIYMTEKLNLVYLIARPLNLRPAITITNGLGETEAASDASGTFRLTNGTYRYRIELEGYVTYTGSFTVADRIKTVEVILYPDSTGEAVSDDGTAGDRWLTVGHSYYTVSSLREHAEMFEDGTLEGITLQELAEHYHYNPQKITSITITSRDGRQTHTVGGSDAARYAILWSGSGSETVFGLYDTESKTVEDADVSRVSILYHDHSEVEKILSEPTCTEAGRRQFTCTECGEIREEEIPALGHDFDWNGICRRCGAEQVIDEEDTFVYIGERAVSLTEMQRFTTEANYKYIESMDGSSYTISVTGITLRDLFTHFPEQDGCVSSVTVTGTDGYSGTYGGSDFDSIMIAWLIDGAVPGSYDTDNGLRIAVNGGRSGDWLFSPVLLDAETGDHSYGDPVTIEPTCGAEGYTYKVCSQCGQTEYYDVLPATGNHHWDSGHDVTDEEGNPTGTKIYYCTVCGASRTGQAAGSGDLNGDGKTGAADLAMMQAALLGRTMLDETAFAAADLNGDGKLTAADLLRLRKIVAGKSVSGE